MINLSRIHNNVGFRIEIVLPSHSLMQDVQQGLSRSKSSLFKLNDAKNIEFLVPNVYISIINFNNACFKGIQPEN